MTSPTYPCADCGHPQDTHDSGRADCLSAACSCGRWLRTNACGRPWPTWDGAPIVGPFDLDPCDHPACTFRAAMGADA